MHELGDDDKQGAKQRASNTAMKRLTDLLAWTLESAASSLLKYGYSSWFCPVGYVSSLASRIGTMMRRTKMENLHDSCYSSKTSIVEDSH